MVPHASHRHRHRRVESAHRRLRPRAKLRAVVRIAARAWAWAKPPCAPAGQSLIGDLFPPQPARSCHGYIHARPARGSVPRLLQRRRHRRRIRLACGVLFACIPGCCLPGWHVADSRTRARRPGCGAAARRHHDAAREIAVTRRCSSYPTMWWIILSGIFHNFNMYAINAFQTPFLQRFHEMSLREANNVSAISVGAVGAIGLLGRRLARGPHEHAKRRDGRLLLAACSMAIAAPSIFFARQSAQGLDRGIHAADGDRHHDHVRLLRHGVRRHSRCDRTPPARHGGRHLLLRHVRARRKFGPLRLRDAERSLRASGDARRGRRAR